MSAVSSTVLTSNRLLQSLPSKEYERLRPNLHQVHLPRGRVLCEAGDVAQDVYFPLSGVVSLLSSTEAGEVIEIGMVGNEGTTALPVIMHAREMPYRAVIQVPVDALRSDPGVMKEESKPGGRLESLLVCYTHSLFTQIFQSAYAIASTQRSNDSAVGYSVRMIGLSRIPSNLRTRSFPICLAYSARW